MKVEADMWPSESIQVAVQLAIVVVPVGLYFLVLGLLNSRRHPQMLSGRLDFVLLTTATSPLLVVPVLHWVGVSASSLAITVIVVAGGICLLAPRGRTWVIYNLTAKWASRRMEQVLDRMGLDWSYVGGEYILGESGARVRIQSFPLLRNVSVRFEGPSDLARSFEQYLGGSLSSARAETPAMASALLLGAMALIMTPLALMSNQAVQIVRLLSDLVN